MPRRRQRTAPPVTHAFYQSSSRFDDTDTKAKAGSSASSNKSRLGQSAQQMIDARRAQSQVVKGEAGAAVTMVYNDTTMMMLICQYMIMPDLYELRQCSRTCMKAVTTYVRAPHGLAQRLWDRMRYNTLYQPLVVPIQQFQASVAAAGTRWLIGSASPLTFIHLTLVYRSYKLCDRINPNVVIKW
jgi:hypothetical protein